MPVLTRSKNKTVEYVSLISSDEEEDHNQKQSAAGVTGDNQAKNGSKDGDSSKIQLFIANKDVQVHYVDGFKESSQSKRTSFKVDDVTKDSFLISGGKSELVVSRMCGENEPQEDGVDEPQKHAVDQPKHDTIEPKEDTIEPKEDINKPEEDALDKHDNYDCASNKSPQMPLAHSADSNDEEFFSFSADDDMLSASQISSHSRKSDAETSALNQTVDVGGNEQNSDAISGHSRESGSYDGAGEHELPDPVVGEPSFEERELEVEGDELEVEGDGLENEDNELEVEEHGPENEEHELEYEDNELEIEDNEPENEDNELEIEDNEFKIEVNELEVEVNEPEVEEHAPESLGNADDHAKSPELSNHAVPHFDHEHSVLSNSVTGFVPLPDTKEDEKSPAEENPVKDELPKLNPASSSVSLSHVDEDLNDDLFVFGSSPEEEMDENLEPKSEKEDDTPSLANKRKASEISDDDDFSDLLGDSGKKDVSCGKEAMNALESFFNANDGDDVDGASLPSPSKPSQSKPTTTSSGALSFLRSPTEPLKIVKRQKTSLDAIIGQRTPSVNATDGASDDTKVRVSIVSQITNLENCILVIDVKKKKPLKTIMPKVISAILKQKFPGRSIDLPLENHCSFFHNKIKLGPHNTISDLKLNPGESVIELMIVSLDKEATLFETEYNLLKTMQRKEERMKSMAAHLEASDVNSTEEEWAQKINNLKEEEIQASISDAGSDVSDGGDSDGAFSIKLLDKSNKPITVKVTEDMSISDVFALYKEQREVAPNAHVSIMFDGDVVEMTDTLQELELEDGDMLEFVIK